MAKFIQASVTVCAILGFSLGPAGARDPAAKKAAKVPLSLEPIPNHEKYLGWSGLDQLAADEAKASEIQRAAKRRFAAAADIPPMERWLPIRFAPSATAGEVNWTPGLLVKVRHAHPDEMAVSTYGLLVNRHIRPDSRFELKGPVTRDTPGRDEVVDGAAVSFESMPGGQNYTEADGRTVHQRDWDFLVATRNRIWAQVGIKETDPTLKKLKALAEYVRDRQFLQQWSYSVHPVDYLLHSAYCTGRANSLMALVTTMGLPVRCVGHAHHSMCEIRIEGKWYFFENSSYERFTTANGNYMELTSHPEQVQPYGDGQIGAWGYGWVDLSGEDMVTSGTAYLLAPNWWHMNWTGGGLAIPTTFRTLENGCGITVCLDGQTAHALYPEADTYYLKASPTTGMYMVAGKYGWWHSFLALQPGQAVKRTVYMGDVQDLANPTTYVEMTVLCAPGATRDWPEYGGDLYVRVNGHVSRFEWKGLQWRAESIKVPIAYEAGYMMNPAGLKYVEYDQIRIPIRLRQLRSNALNELEFGLSGPRGAGLKVMIFPDPVLPYGSAYAPGELPPQEQFEITPDHVCEMTNNFYPRKPHVVTPTWSSAEH